MSAASVMPTKPQGVPFKSTHAAGCHHYREVHSLPPGRLGSPRRKPKGATRPRSGPRVARSLDNPKYLATTSTEWLQSLETAADKWRQKLYFQKVLIASVEKVFRGLEERLHWLPPGDIAERKYVKGKMEIWAKSFRRLSSCQSQWVAYKANCCSAAIAVPIHCNHRLCFLCNSRRCEKFRKRVVTMLDRLEHPVFLTLTVPNKDSIRKRDFQNFRKWERKFFKQHKAWVKGGIYSLETTYNRFVPQNPWHLHSHAILDSTIAIPACLCGTCECGRKNRKPKEWQTEAKCSKCRGDLPWLHIRRVTGEFTWEHRPDCEFVRFKRRLEYDWLLCSGGRKAGWGNRDFDFWYSHTLASYPWRSAAACSEWQSGNRRSVDIRRVNNRKKASFEVVKYITKCVAFADIPEAVAEFGEAVRGARCLQTFGSWYGVDLSESDDLNGGLPSEKNSWRGLKCNCGKNDFVQIGMLYRQGVFMDDNGCWHPKLNYGLFLVSDSPPGG